MLNATCKKCGSQFHVRDELAGKRVKCPVCHGTITLPEGPSAAPPAPPDSPTPADPDPLDTLLPPAGPPPPAAATPPAEAQPPAATPLPEAPGTAGAASADLPQRRRTTKLPFGVLIGAGGVLVVGLLLMIATCSPDSDPDDTVANTESNLPEDDDSDPFEPDAPPSVPDRPAPRNVAPPAPRNPLPTPDRTPRDPKPDRVPNTTPVTPPDPRPNTTPGPGLSGMARQYDDLRCQQIQLKFGVQIPASATILEVDGVRLPVNYPGELAKSPAALLLLSRGVHSVRFRTSDLPIEVTIDADLLDTYQAMRGYFNVSGQVNGEELMRRGAWAMDVHGSPFLLNFMGARHAKEKRWDVAERAFRRSLSVNPTFSPAHLNLAECLLQRKKPEQAAEEINAADLFNVGNVYGLQEAINVARKKQKMPMGKLDPVNITEFSYVTTETITQQDRQMAALMEEISKYVVKPGERGKIINNLAIHFADTDRPELALHHFRQALAVVKVAGTDRFAIARQIFVNMSGVCKEAGFAEADEYQRMQSMVSP